MPTLRLGPRGARGVKALAVGCAGLVGFLVTWTTPPSSTSAHPSVAPASDSAGRVAIADAQCRLVRRAPRTWVGFADGMTLDDMLPATNRALSIVRALNGAVCGFLRHDQLVPALRGHDAQLKAQAADGGTFEVTSVVWQDATFARARVELRARREASGDNWLLSVVRHGQAWKLETCSAQPR